jgi:hypothetical protein
VIFPNPFRFIAAMWRAFCTWVRGYRVLVPMEVQDERHYKCLNGCEHYDYGQCKLCSCFTSAKVLFADEECSDKPPRWRKWKE